MTSNSPARYIAAAALASLSLPLGAQVLMLDFGNTTGTSLVGSNNTSSPYHSATGSTADFSWNASSNGNKTSGTLVWSDGTTATGISTSGYKFNADTTTSSGSTGWNQTFNGSAATSVQTGIYAQGNAAYDGALTGTSSAFATEDRATGIQISGLSIGTYDIYISGRYNPYAGSESYTQTFYAGTAASAGHFNFASLGYISDSVTFTSDNTSKTSSWVYSAGDASTSNYVKLTVSITSEGQVLNIASQGSGTFSGVLNSIQIVAVPEPSSFALLGGAAGLLFATGRRRRPARS